MGVPRNGNVGTVYLLHLDPALKHSSHYIGWTSWDVNGRVQYHVDGNGSRFLKAAVDAGCDVKVVRTWERVGRHFERSLKNRKNAKALCPVCSGEKALERGRKACE